MDKKNKNILISTLNQLSCKALSLSKDKSINEKHCIGQFFNYTDINSLTFFVESDMIEDMSPRQSKFYLEMLLEIKSNSFYMVVVSENEFGINSLIDYLEIKSKVK